MGLFSYLLESDLRAINWLRWLTLRQLWLSHKEPMPTLMYTWLCEVYAHMCTWLGRPCAHAVARGRHVCSTLSLSAWFLWDMASYWTWSWTGNQQEPVILASALLQHWGYATKGHSPLCVFAGDLNSSPHACVAIALTLSKLFPHPVLSKQLSLQKELYSCWREQLSFLRVLTAAVKNSTTCKLIEDLIKLINFAHSFRYSSKVI